MSKNQIVKFDGEYHAISVTIPYVVMVSLALYIKKGPANQEQYNRAEFEMYPHINRIDTSVSKLIRYLLTSDYCYVTPPAEYLFEELVKRGTQNSYVHIRTNNPLILLHRDHNTDLIKRLICAMVWNDIPIVGYFDGKDVIS